MGPGGLWSIFSRIISIISCVAGITAYITGAIPECIADDNRVSNVIKIQSNQEASEGGAYASIAAFCEVLSHARSTASGMMPMTTPTALEKKSYIRRMPVMIRELV